LVATAREYIAGVKEGSIDPSETIPEFIEQAKQIQKKYNAFITLNEDVDFKPKGALAGLPVSVKDNICTKGIMTTAGSKILEGYIPPFDATAISKIKGEGAFILGKTAQDEFGFGTFSTNCAYGIPRNPLDTERSCGGSSGGAAALTAAADFPHIAIAQSTGGSITAPAAFTGTVGITPTYGRVSRYGLIDYANSMDKIGVIAKNVYDAALGLSVISGYDPMDSTSANVSAVDFTKSKAPAKPRIALPKQYFDSTTDKRVAGLVMKATEKMESQGMVVEQVDMPLTKYSIPAYYMIAITEASTNLAKFCGLRYGMQPELKGNFDEYFSKVRSEGFGTEAKRRIILGTYARMTGFREAYYIKAMRVRAKITEEFKSVFKGFDAVATPSMPILAPRFSDIEKMSPIEIYNMDLMTTAANMCGLPTVSVPVGKIEGLPVGMQLIGDHFNEEKIIGISAAVEGLE